MRKLLILASLVVAFLAIFQLSRIAGGWHYIVSAPAGELIYATSFDGDMADWSQDERSNFSYRVQDGVLRMAIEPVPSLTGQHGLSNWQAYLADFDIQVSARLLEGNFDGSHNNGYGVVFRRYDAQNYYLFILSNDGSYRVIRVLDGIMKPMSNWIVIDNINRDINALNHLRVVGKGDTFQFYINDQLLELCIPDSPDGVSTFDFNGNCMGTMKTELVDNAIPFGYVGVGLDLDERQPEGFIVVFDDVLIYSP
ncbi:MAG: hypothetical protein SFZ02_19555 [bacterium]|nr:hypothetical protein [bacterium]